MKVNIASINHYFQQADATATRFVSQFGNLPRLQDALLNHREKYLPVFSRRAWANIPLLMAIPAHLAVGLIEGLILAPLFKSLFRGLIIDETLLMVASYLPVLIFWGITLAIGYCAHHIGLKKHQLEPGRYAYDFWSITATPILTVGYLYILHQLMQAGQSRAPGQENLIALILWIGVAELILGLFAAKGWEVAYAYSKLNLLQWRLKRSLWRQDWLAHRCAQYYHFYQQSLQQYNQYNRFHLEERINHRIGQTLDFKREKTTY